ncbi:type I restriction enzyme, S subunit [Desulfuromonas thiophila]|uniref:Type I restriction enzyme, S subunit n=2 Tax=Desulfuromonas thiophila TaxID=57664 RepID=A0A1G7DYB2_9BACT|nr:type I restriction enzyme, S subunit [Desulfuromonas thiophila]
MIGRYGPPVFQILRGLEGAYNVALMKATPNEEFITKDFLFKFLSSPPIQKYVIDLSSRAAGQSGLNKATLEPYPISFPSLPEQKRIVAILDEAFAGIDAAVANTEKNLANARELFESYLNAVFTQKGDGWVDCPLADCLQLITYGFTNPMPTTDAGPYMITAKNVIGGQINYASARHTSQDAFTNLLTDKSRPLIGDVLLTKDGTLGRLAVVDRTGLCINQSIALLRPNERMDAHFMRYLLSSPYYQQKMREDAGGTTIKHIYITRVDKMTVSFPTSLQNQKSILETLNSMAKETQRLEAIYQQKLDALAELKQSILQKAFAGELTTLPENEIEEAIA